MGGVSSVQTDSSSSLYLRNPGRFSIACLDIYDPSSHRDLENVSSGVTSSSVFAQARPVLHVDNNLKVTGDVNANVEFIQDPDSQAFPFVLKVPYHPRLLIRFKLVLNSAGDQASIDNLTFISAKSLKQLDNFITTEFFHNPNIQNEDNVALLGDFSPAQPETVDFVWEWSAKQQTPPAAKGSKTVLCFAEYNKREHSLQQLCNCTLWFEASQLPLYGVVPPSPSPPLPSSAFSSSEFNTTCSSLYSSLLDNQKPRSRMPSASVSVAPASPVIEKPSHQFEDYMPAQEPVSSNTNNNNATITSSNNNDRSPKDPSPGETIINATQQQPQQHQASEQSPQSTTTLEEPIDAVLQREKKAQMAVPRPDDDSSSQPEDGPLFRATISSLEKKTGNLKMKTKKLIKRAILLQERQIGLIDAHRLFLQALHEIGESEVPAFKSIIYSYFDRSGGQLDFVAFLRDSSHDIQAHLIDPLRKLYENEIKAFDNRKREFDDESSQYYSWLSRYLSVKQEAKGKKKVESDSKYLEKRKAFELCRFDYYSYMQDLHGGRKQQDVTYELALYAESEANRIIATAEKLKTSVKPQLDSVVDEVRDANKDWSRQRTEREVRRRALERSIMSPSDLKSPAELFTHEQQQNQNWPKDTVPVPQPQPLQQAAPIGWHGTASPIAPRPNSPGTVATVQAKKDDQPKLRIVTNNVSKNGDYPKTPKDECGGEFASQQLVQTPKQGPGDEPPPVATFSSSNASNAPQSAGDNIKKEGLLWAMSRPGGVSDPISNLNKAGWHKFWVVLAEGKLCEYTNWKQGVVDLHNEPINLRVALVREARNSDRRFCFEVVTPNYKRVYQTTSEEDMQAWIRAINNGITSSLEGQPDEKSYMPAPMQPPVSTGAGAGGGGGGPHFSEKIQRKISLNKRLHRDAIQPYIQPNQQHSSVPPIPSMITNSTKGGVANSAVTQPGAPAISEVANSSAPGSGAATIEEECGLIHKIRAISPSNSRCADCGSSNKCEWMSINLLVILCIDCSGVHRSLGSHISKIRSLKLDTVSFNPDLVALIKSVSNEKMNQIWEAGLAQKTGSISSDNKARATFITEKYVEKKYVRPVERPNSSLRQAVVNGDVIEVIHSLASRANADSVDEDNVSMLLHSLRVTRVPPFKIPELLVLNSATVPATVPDFLSDEAKAYLAKKVKH
ncbi:hypothetical protein TRVA0_005S01816 [Trichomonascus vanleenenianus]|uniref:ADP-ribosylation factor GTPase-activating family protein n=1 Tax=Trichomonascus vanleenenianus TaxID=2268995 RepID=UPI003ECA1EF1